MDKIDLFYCSKPLQYLNAQNIPFKDNSNKKILLLVRNFYQAKEFFENVKRFDCHWDEVISFKSTLGAFLYIFFHRVKNLYINYDCGTMIGVFYLIKRINIYLLEEGAATYLDYYFKKNKIRRYIDNLLGVGSYLGHSTYLKGAFVYYPDFYKERKKVDYDVMSFNCSFIDAIKNNYDFFIKLSSMKDLYILNIKNSKILVYVTDWIINNNIINLMEEDLGKYDFVFIKPHPHIKSTDIEICSNIKIVKTNLMMEFIIYKWIENNNSITVLHEGTSAIFYFNDYIKSIDMSKNRDSEYNRLISGHKTLIM